MSCTTKSKQCATKRVIVFKKKKNANLSASVTVLNQQSDCH